MTFTQIKTKKYKYRVKPLANPMCEVERNVNILPFHTKNNNNKYHLHINVIYFNVLICFVQGVKLTGIRYCKSLQKTIT